MSSVDRAVRRGARHLQPGEALLASALGREAEGRRRHVVLLTDRRVVVAPLRPEDAQVLALDRCDARFDPVGALLTVEDGEHVVRLRDVEESDALQVIELLQRRMPSTPQIQRPAIPKVRILPG